MFQPPFHFINKNCLCLQFQICTKKLEQPLSQKAIRYEAWKQKLERERNEYTTIVKEESRCFQATTQQNKAIF